MIPPRRGGERDKRRFKLSEYSGVVGYSEVFQPKIVKGLAIPASDDITANIAAIRFYVEKKRSKWFLRLTLRRPIPKKIMGFPTDIVEIGKVRILVDPRYVKAKQKRRAVTVTPADRQKRIDPIPAGVSVGEENITAGTHTLLVKDKTDGKKVTSSNSHVFNGYGAPVGSRIFQPGKYDGGKVEDTYATLKRAVPISFGGISDCPAGALWTGIYNRLAKLFGASTRLRAVIPIQAANEVDFAIGELIGPRVVVPGVLLENGELHVPKQVGEPYVGMKVWKCGRTSGYTESEVIDTEASLTINYGMEGDAFFVHQCLIAGEFYEPGDSGSPTFEKPTGDIAMLGFAGSSQIGVANHFKRVCELGQVELL